METIYLCLEACYPNHEEIEKIKKELRSGIDKIEDSDLINQLKIELIVLEYTIVNGEPQPHITISSKNPFLEDLLTHQNYIKKRLKETSNPFLKLRYNEVLIEINKNSPDNRVSNLYIDEVISIVKQHPHQEFDYLDTAECVLLALKESFRSKYKQQELLELINSLLKDTKYPDHLKLHLLNVLTRQNLFKRRKQLKQLFDEYVKDNLKKADKLTNESFWEATMGFSQKINDNNTFRLANEALGKIYFNMGLEREHIEAKEKDPSFLASYLLIQKSLSFLKASNNNTLLTNATNEYIRIKKKLNLKEISSSITEENNKLLLDEAHNIINQILSKSNPIRLLIHNNQLLSEVLPNKDSENDFIFDSQFYKVNEITGNSINVGADKGSISKYKQAFSYSFFYSINNYILYRVFIEGYKKGIFDIKNIIEEISGGWLGQKFSTAPNKHQDHKNNQFAWIELIEPSIYCLSQTVEQFITTKKINQNLLILTIDSMTLKFEGILRHFITLKEGATTRVVGNRTEELTLERLLNAPELVKLLSKGEIQYFKYLFGSEFGKNIRNNIAHGLYRPQHYRLETALNLLFAILRLSKY